MASRAVSFASFKLPRLAASWARAKYRDSRASSPDLWIAQIFTTSAGVNTEFVSSTAKVMQWGHTSSAKLWRVPQRLRSASICTNSFGLEDRRLSCSGPAWMRAYSPARRGVEKVRRQGVELG